MLVYSISHFFHVVISEIEDETLVKFLNMDQANKESEEHESKH